MQLVTTTAPEQPILIAGIGPITSALETLATTVGAGLILGSFVVGVIGLIAQSRPAQYRLARAGYVGGVAAVFFLFLDAIIIFR